MIVGELIDLLESLPDDTVVLINHKHVEYVTTEPAGPSAKRRRVPCKGGCLHGVVDHWDRVDVPPAVMIGSRRAVRVDPEPPVQLYGRTWTADVKALFS